MWFLAHDDRAQLMAEATFEETRDEDSLALGFRTCGTTGGLVDVPADDCESSAVR